MIFMDYWTPLWSSILESSVWTEPYYVRVLWVTMLAAKDRDHVVRHNAFQLARLGEMTEQEVIDGLKVLSSPDKKRIEKQPFDGRRIEKVDDGWLILNGVKYQKKIADLTTRARKAAWARENRAAKRGKPLPMEGAYSKAVDRGDTQEELDRIQDNAFKEQSPPYRAESNGEPV